MTDPKTKQYRRRVLAAGAALPFLALARAGQAQGLSSRPISIVLGQTAATTNDLIARTIAPRMAERWKQPFIVENRGGAGGSIGLAAVAKAPPDGHVITVSVNSTLTLPHFFKIDFDVLHSFTPITMLAENIFALVVHPSVPATNLKEFIAWASREGAAVNYGSPGNGTQHHLMMETFKLRTGLKLTHIPYKGSAPAFNDLMGGQISAMFVPLGTALSLGPSGKVRAIGGSARERSPLASQLPSLHEQGLENFNFPSSYYALGPAGMPADLVARYIALFRDVMNDTGVRETLAKQGVSVRLSTPTELAQANREDYAMMEKLIRDAKIKGD